MSGATAYRLPFADQRAAFAARLDLYGGRYAGITREDRELAATVELPHLWTPWRCLTCQAPATECTGDHDQAAAAFRARQQPPAEPCPSHHCPTCDEPTVVRLFAARGQVGLEHPWCPSCGWTGEL